MAENETDTQEAGGTIWDAPNQQVVRDDASAPWEEGTGGETGTPVNVGAEFEPVEASGQAVTDDDLDAMTKDELLAHAKDAGVTPANAGMTKDELRESIAESRR